MRALSHQRHKRLFLRMIATKDLKRGRIRAVQSADETYKYIHDHETDVLIWTLAITDDVSTAFKQTPRVILIRRTAADRCTKASRSGNINKPFNARHLAICAVYWKCHVDVCFCPVY